MNKAYTFKEFEQSDFSDLVSMSQFLWGDMDAKDIESAMKEITQTEKNKVTMAKDTHSNNVAFSYFSIRTDYVEGASNSPTGYLEGIYVKEEFRKMGIASALIRLGEKWCKEKGCAQLGSDTWLTDTNSRAFHKKLGFWEEDELVHFLKDIE